jgi:arginyl-tRNA synthetase
MQGTIRDSIETALKKLGLTGANFDVDYPTDKHAAADYYSNVALVVAKSAVESPKVIADKICAELAGEIKFVDSAVVAGPGFINFTLTRDYFSQQIELARSAKESWGKNDSLAGKKVLVEYTDPNPFKEFHVGHLFTNAVGESIARLFMMNGADTKRINYQGDVGLHVACAIWGMQEMDYDSLDDFSAKDLGRAYAVGAKDLKESEVAAEKIREINRKIYSREDEAINAMYDAGRGVSLSYFESIYDIVGTTFDEYFFESEVSDKGKEIVESHPELFPESEGARIFKGEEHGLHTRVFLNQEGLPTYEAKELALAQLKAERLGEYDLSIVSTANEINDYFKVLLKAMSFVYPELAAKTEHIGHGMVRLAEGKMSSRTGDVIPAKKFIDEVALRAESKMDKDDLELGRAIAIAAIKYVTLKGSITQDSVFDREAALSFEGDSGPYLQYTHARICSVLEKAAGEGVTPDTQSVPNESYQVEKLVHQFPEIIASALLERAPHQLTQYLTELAGEFNTFYATERIADANDEFAPYKAAVAEAVAITLKNGLWTLGIEAPERM